jgi:hypothetical protein
MIMQVAFVRSLNPRACWRWIERVQARVAPEATRGLNSSQVSDLSGNLIAPGSETCMIQKV